MSTNRDPDEARRREAERTRLLHAALMAEAALLVDVYHRACLQSRASHLDALLNLDPAHQHLDILKNSPPSWFNPDDFP